MVVVVRFVVVAADGRCVVPLVVDVVAAEGLVVRIHVGSSIIVVERVVGLVADDGIKVVVVVPPVAPVQRLPVDIVVAGRVGVVSVDVVASATVASFVATGGLSGNVVSVVNRTSASSADGVCITTTFPFPGVSVRCCSWATSSGSKKINT